jgi:hypothetical protein
VDSGPAERHTEAANRAIAGLRDARLQLDEVCAMLLRPSPEVLDACESRLMAVVAKLESSRTDWSRAAGDALASVEAVGARKALRRASRLLNLAAAFYAGWQRIRVIADGGYGADGAPVQMRHRARLVAEA